MSDRRPTARDRQAAVTAYMVARRDSPGINPWRVFEAGWDAALEATAPREFPAHDEVRSSGWSGPIV